MFTGGSSSSLQPPMVEVIPAVTSVRPPQAAVGDIIELHGSGFSPQREQNQVLLPNGHGCSIVSAEYGRVRCKVTAAAAGYVREAAGRGSRPHARDTGFPLTIAVDTSTVITHEHHGVHPVRTGPWHGCNSTDLTSQELRSCVGSLPPRYTEVVHITSEVLWPSLHPMRYADGAWRKDAVVAYGAAVFRPPSAATPLRLRLVCHGIGASCEGWISLAAGVAGGPSNTTVHRLGSGADVLLRRPDFARVELLMVHGQHAHQMELLYSSSDETRPSEPFQPVPAEWFEPAHDSTAATTASHDAANRVHVSVRGGEGALCRSTWNDEGAHGAHCHLSVLPSVAVVEDATVTKPAPAEQALVRASDPVAHAAARKRRSAAADLHWSDLKDSQRGRESPVVGMHCCRCGLAASRTRAARACYSVICLAILPTLWPSCPLARPRWGSTQQHP